MQLLHCDHLQVEGVVHHDWIEVQKAFEENFALNMELGAQLHITHKDRVVLDLSGMSKRQQREGGRPYSRDTLQNVYSCGKNVEALCMAILVDRGLISYDDLVCKHWPEFGQHGKDCITISDVLRHEGGVPFFSDPGAMENYKRDRKVSAADVRAVLPLERLIEGSGRWTLTGERHYHACTRGWILSSILRRVDPKERSMGRFIKEEIAVPLNVDVYCGIPASEQSQFEFAKIRNISPSYSLVNYILPAVTGFGDPALKGVISTFKQKTNPAKRHGYYIYIT